LKGKWSKDLEKISLDLKEETELACSWDAENDIRMSFRQR